MNILRIKHQEVNMKCIGNKKIIKIIVLISVIIFFIVTYLFYLILNKSSLYTRQYETIDAGKIEYVNNYPSLKLPKEYAIENILKITSPYKDTNNNYLIDIYFQPSGNIDFIEKYKYSNKKRSLPEPVDKKTYLDRYMDQELELCELNTLCESKEENYNRILKEFSVFGTRFMNLDNYDHEQTSRWDIYKIDNIDIDNDNEAEKIVYLSEFVDHYDEEILIIKNNKIIFSLGSDKESLVKITSTENNKGFYVEWRNLDKYYKLNTEIKNRTKFMISDSLYKPIEESEILSIQIEQY